MTGAFKPDMVHSGAVMGPKELMTAISVGIVRKFEERKCSEVERVTVTAQKEQWHCMKRHRIVLSDSQSVCMFKYHAYHMMR